ncbi:uncharacterized protein LOC126989069 isoform X2 [Eriocheir sinensis]|uniref:uncharacterized protein LOC126989069 isoform X2 n=1 Tax=Eriocheir sinensis TaxID=95602 RepID=UPI0021C80891|nr:uncharacterized protein LOC126989069 isoform X2 [Eriocheir sinensis]XP_050703587.1 uncharacterized protein LOC126989069 isoform X2 [Eriocheir sinensis]XP_050703588.1 uncharacterized protein LOC126989069 isoform X2 [Eriocheir sinensis]XP_050703589.1 uncharacterized protein LOC126989069 isoform X2 [Eriocheir sinensis]XP_050703590.1 uncharacterized protein LOC126989069 isoform X2 [Eriocheir sinensis]XP_050703591.1 uncharacterized protein LOC126989069 isoform X2 [Eriocheir sinensis]
MGRRKKNATRKDGDRGQSEVSNPTKPSVAMAKVPSPTGFNLDDFLFSKLFKSVNGEGNRTINKIVKTLFHQKIPEKSSACTLGEILNEENLRRKPKRIHVRCKNILEEKPCNAKFDINCGIGLLEEIFNDEYSKLSEHCRAQIHSLKELRNSLSQKYPLVLCDFEAHNEVLNELLKENLEYVTLINEVAKLEEKKNGLPAAAEIKEIQGSIDEKKKEIYVVTEIEKLRLILNDILENMSNVLNTDLTDCRSMVNKNLTDISKAKVQQYDQATYDREVGLFKDDPMHKLITKGREEMKKQYKCLKIANPCPWICMDQSEKLSTRNFSIEKIYTPLRIVTSRKEISTEKLITENVSKNKTVILYGPAGSGKTSLCLHYLHHWTEGTDDIETLKDYSLVIYVELRTVRSNTIERFLKEQRMKNSADCIDEEDLVQQLDDLKLLFIIDGYDEAKEECRKVVRDICSKFPNQLVMVTTRTELREEVKNRSTRVTCTYLEICGFDESRIKGFTEKVFNAVVQSKYFMETETKASRAINSSEFLHYVEGRGKILEKHLELPLTLALMIYMWIDCPEVLNNVTTCTSLYYELFKLCQEKIKTRLRYCYSENLESVLILLGKKAWQLLQNDEDSLSNDDEKEIDEECRKRKVPKEEVLSAFLMYDVDDNSDENRYDYSFMHRTQMEYLSAYFWAEEAEKKDLNDIVGPVSPLFGLHQIIVFLVGHFTRKGMLNQKMEEVFELLSKIQVEDNDFDFWWRLLTESQINGEPSKNLSLEIIKKKITKKTWKLSSVTAVPGLECLIHTPAQIEELIIEMENDEDPYNIKDFFITMKSLKAKLRGRYDKKKPLLVELFFWHHCERRCRRPSNDLLGTLDPWGHLIDFVGSVGEYNDKFMPNFCLNLKRLRVRVETRGAQVSLFNSLARIGGRMKELRVLLDLDPKECNPETLACLKYDKFIDLELTLQHMEDEHMKWIVQVVKKVSGRNGCCKLILEKSTLSFPTVEHIVEMLCNVVHEHYKIESTNDLTPEQKGKLKRVEWNGI